MEYAEHVRIVDAALESFAANLDADELRASTTNDVSTQSTDRESAAAFAITIASVNFGSGYFPELRKRGQRSGYRTIESFLQDRFNTYGPFSVAELGAMDSKSCAELFQQDLTNPHVAELMAHFADAFRDLGEWLDLRGGSYAGAVDAANAQARTLVRGLIEMPLFQDVSNYRDRVIPFFKRAQLCVADLHVAGFPFTDIDRLTLFADNLVAHVLRMDGVLEYTPRLVARIERGELIPHGSAEEVEIRAAEVIAAERIAGCVEPTIQPRELDAWLWQRGGQARYKARPRHRTRCVYY